MSSLRNSPIFSYICIVSGISILACTAWYSNLALRYGGFSSKTLILFLSLFGIWYVYAGYFRLINPTWFIEKQIIYAQNVTKHVTKKYIYASVKNLILENSKLFLMQDGQKRLITEKWKCHPKDWKIMCKKILHEQAHDT